MLLLIAQGFCYRIKAIHNNKTLIRRLAMKLVLSHSRIVTSLLGKSPENIFNTAYNPKKCCPCLQNFLYCKLSIMVFFSGGTLGPGTVPILSVRHHYGRAEGGEQTLRVSESGMWQRELSSLPRGLAHSTPMRGGREGRRLTSRTRWRRPWFGTVTVANDPISNRYKVESSCRNSYTFAVKELMLIKIFCFFQDGCNKISCCNCGALMCYICR